MGDSLTVNLNSLVADLDADGLNLCHRFSVDYLADSMPNLSLPAKSCELLLIGNYGNALWQAMPAACLSRPHPVDSFTTDCVTRALEKQVAKDSWSLLFPHTPDDINLSLQQLGALAGWHHPSPLGIGINKNLGLWFAYRAVVVLNVQLNELPPVRRPWSEESPCIACEYTPCVTACPASALTSDKSPDLTACVNHRITSESSCASTCLARVACPVAPQWQYQSKQLAYFYERSLPSLKQWVASG